MAETTGARRLNPPPGGLPPERQAAVAAKVVGQIGAAVGVRASVEALGTVLRADENVVCAATGFLQGRTVLVMFTSERVLIMRGRSLVVDLGHSAIRRFRALTGVAAHDLQIENQQGSVLTIKQIHPKEQLPELSRLLSGGPQPTPRPDTDSRA